MAGSVNKVILVGNLGADPEIRALESGQKVARLSLATNRSYNNRDGQRVDETEWHRVEVWGRLAEIAEKYLNKGRTIYIEGRIRTRKWTDQNNIEKYTTEIVGETLTMLGNREDSRPANQPQSNQPLQATPPTSQPAPAQPVAAPATPTATAEEGDLPF
jgi:single-strand DNA-binding protein